MDDYLSATEQPATPVAEVLDKKVFTPTKPLTRKQKAFVKELIDNPKISATEAAIRTYDTDDRNTAHSIATENLRKPAIMMELGTHSDLFESVIVGTARDWGQADSTRKREIALDAAKYGHDKVHGKATVKLQQESTVVKIAINLTGDGEEPPRQFVQATQSPSNGS